MFFSFSVISVPQGSFSGCAIHLLPSVVNNLSAKLLSQQIDFAG